MFLLRFRPAVFSKMSSSAVVSIFRATLFSAGDLLCPGFFRLSRFCAVSRFCPFWGVCFCRLLGLAGWRRCRRPATGLLVNIANCQPTLLNVFYVRVSFLASGIFRNFVLLGDGDASSERKRRRPASSRWHPTQNRSRGANAKTWAGQNLCRVRVP